MISVLEEDAGDELEEWQEAMLELAREALEVDPDGPDAAAVVGLAVAVQGAAEDLQLGGLFQVAHHDQFAAPTHGAAAQLLGLSRQGLYAKLGRYDLDGNTLDRSDSAD